MFTFVNLLRGFCALALLLNVNSEKIIFSNKNTSRTKIFIQLLMILTEPRFFVQIIPFGDVY